MKKLKYLIVYFITAYLFAVILAFSSSAISPDHWAIDPVDFNLNQGIIEGTRSTFNPDAVMSRAQFARALAKIGISGGTGNVYGNHLHITVATTMSLSPNPSSSSDPNRTKYIDPRIYID